MLNSYVVRQDDTESFFNWAKNRNFTGRRMPESHPFYNIFMGEFPWAPAFEFHNIPSNDDEGWIQGGEKETIPSPVLVTCDNYAWETGIDCSIEESVQVLLPCKWLVDSLELEWRRTEGSYFDKSGQLVTFDPSVSEPGPSALLASKEKLLKFLKMNGYDLVWTVLGEKNIIGGGILSHRDWQGRLEISGVYRLNTDGFDGKLNLKFRSPEQTA